MQDHKLPSLFIDTNIIYNSYLLDSHSVNKILEYAKITGTKVYISEVVIKEHIQKYELESKEIIKKINDSIDEIKKFNFKSLELPKVELPLPKYEYEKRLREKITSNPIFEIVPYSGDMMDEVIKRAIEVKKPYKKVGEDNKETAGIKDAIIWLSFIKICQTEKLIFLSNNYKDFGIKKEEGFHKDLQEDFEGLKYTPEFIRSTNKLREKYIGIIEKGITEEMIDRILSGETVESYFMDNIDGIEVDVNEDLIDYAYSSFEEFTSYFNCLGNSISFVHINEDIAQVEIKFEAETEMTISYRGSWDSTAERHYKTIYPTIEICFEATFDKKKNELELSKFKDIYIPTIDKLSTSDLYDIESKIDEERREYLREQEKYI